MWDTAGHDRAVRFLERSISAGRLAHAYLIAGRPSVGRMTLALDLARLVNCVGDRPPCSECGQCDRIRRSLHADVQVIGLKEGPEGGRSRVNIGIDQVRDCQRDISLKPFEGKCRIVIFDAAETMSAEASNALLKTLEEPPDHVMIILVSRENAPILPTIVSRCQTLELRPAHPDAIASLLKERHGVDAERARELAAMSGGRPGWAVRALAEPSLLDERGSLLQEIGESIGSTLEGRFEYASSLASEFTRNREKGGQVLDLWLDWWRIVLLKAVSSPTKSASVEGTPVTVHDALRAIRAVLETRSNLQRNVTYRLATEQMMLQMPYVQMSTSGLRQ